MRFSLLGWAPVPLYKSVAWFPLYGETRNLEVKDLALGRLLGAGNSVAFSGK
jgi:hypothetical protein